jgi:hypothetical protein
MNTVTKLQQIWLDRITEAENETVYRTINPGLCWECPDCQSAYDMDEKELQDGIETDEVIDEGGFSTQDCETCGCPLGGDRFAAHGWLNIDGAKTNPILLHYDICGDCVQAIANGEVPDDEYLSWIV